MDAPSLHDLVLVLEAGCLLHGVDHVKHRHALAFAELQRDVSDPTHFERHAAYIVGLVFAA